MIFKMSAKKALNEKTLSEFINKHAAYAAANLDPLKKAYETKYAILEQPPKPKYKPDNRIAVNFAKYITDTFGGFFMGIPVKTFSSDKKVSEYIQYVEKYNDQDDNNAELSKLCDIYGRGYEVYYVDEAGEIGITYLSPREAFMIYDDSIIERPLYFVHVYTDENDITRGSVSDSTRIRYFQIKAGLRFKEEEKLHGFDGVPATEYLENAERTGVFEPIMSMSNAYNKAISEKANDVDYFSDAYLKILGARLDEKEMDHLRDKRIINFDGSGSGNLIVDFLQKPSGDETQENLLDRLERLIYTISMVANISDENFGESSGISLKYKLLNMSNLAKTKERKFISGMNRRYKLIFSNPVNSMKKDDWVKINYKFYQNIPANLLEESQIAANLSGITSRKTQLSVVSAVGNVDEELKQIEKENDPITYNTDYPTNRVSASEGGAG